jgi:spore coat protein H
MSAPLIPSTFRAWRRFGWICWLLGLWLSPFLADAAENATDAASKSATEEIFGLTNIHHFHLQIAAQDYAAMEAIPYQQAGMAPNTLPGKKDADRHLGEAFLFPWVRASLVANGSAYPTVGVRYKGQFTYKASRPLLKRSLKIDLQHFENGRKFGPLKKITLNAGVLDPNKCREALAYAAFREAGVPVPRTAFAEVTLTVPGKYDREYLGLFTLVEDYDKGFLDTHLHDAKGVLMKPAGGRGTDYLGENWQPYKRRYNPNRELTAAETKFFIDYTRAASQSETDEYRQNIDAYLDLDKFLRYVAVSAMIVNLDGPLAMPQNFFMYVPSQPGKKIIFMPWDLDLAFAAWPLGGAVAQQLNWNLLHPQSGENLLIERLLADPVARERYLTILKELADTSLSEQALLKQIDAVESAIKKSVAKEAQAVAARQETELTFKAGRITSSAPTLHEFATQRCASIRAQLSKLSVSAASGGETGK